MDCFLVKNGGGGAPLNFRVVGNPQPANPKENTIWVNTDVPIGKWYFDANQPDDLQEGDVWFSVGTSSPVEFNALRKNGIQVYPLSAKQFVGGALVEKDAQIYQGGEWKDFALTIFDGTTVAEGYKFAQFSGEDCSLMSYAVMGDGYVTMPGDSFFAGLGLQQQIDVTDLRVVEVDVQWTANGSGITGKYVIMKRSLSGNFDADRIVSVSVEATSTTRQTVKLDVSNVTGGLYIIAGHYFAEGTANVRIYSLRCY